MSIRQRFAQFLSPTDATGFKVLGDYWVASFTNNFLDRDGELITAKAHDRYVERVKAGLVPLPELWLWHLGDETRHGEAVWLDKVGHMVVAIGTFDHSDLGRHAKAHYAQHQKYEVSHGFMYPVWARNDKGEIEDYNTFEISTLPLDKAVAANPYTSFQSIKEMQHMVTDLQKQSITEVFGDKAPQIITQLEAIDKRGDKIAAMGVKHKDFAELGDESAQKSKRESVIQQDFATLVLEKQAELSDQLETVMQLLDGGLKAVRKNHTDTSSEIETLKSEWQQQMDAAKAAHEAQVTELKALIDALKSDTPASVQAGEGAAVQDEKAKGQINAQMEDDDEDKMFAGTGYRKPKK